MYSREKSQPHPTNANSNIVQENGLLGFTESYRVGAWTHHVEPRLGEKLKTNEALAETFPKEVIASFRLASGRTLNDGHKIT